MHVYEDLTVCGHRSKFGRRKPLSVGWLGAKTEFVTGELSDGIVEKLSRLVATGAVNRVRHWEPCPFCDDEYPVQMNFEGVLIPVGDAEVHLRSADGITYVAPNLLVHFITAHSYRPPEVFVEAIRFQA